MDACVTTPLDNDHVLAQAAEWVIRCGGYPLSPAERRALDRWLDEDPAHAAAFEQAEATWAELAGLRAAPGLITADLAAARHGKPRRTTHFPWGQVAAIAASLLLLAGGGAIWLGNPVLALMADHRTAPGEIEHVTLADGSIVDLGPASAIATHFDGQERRLTLLAGQAYFTVAPMGADEQRPFVVEAAHGTATALGTQFTVDRQGDGAEVLVVEHRVGVALTPTADVVLEQGQAVYYDQAHGLGVVRRADPEKATAWRRGRLMFDDVPLEQVVAELNRYRRGRIVVADRALAGRRVSGVFQTDNLDTALEAITSELGASTASLSPLLTILY
jgi:transmembrane sensor